MTDPRHRPCPCALSLLILAAIASGCAGHDPPPTEPSSAASPLRRLRLARPVYTWTPGTVPGQRLRLSRHGAAHPARAVLRLDGREAGRLGLAVLRLDSREAGWLGLATLRLDGLFSLFSLFFLVMPP